MILMRHLYLFVFLAFLSFACGQEGASERAQESQNPAFTGDYQELKAQDIPETIRLDGKLLNALKYEDLSGDYHFTVYQTGPMNDPRSEDGIMASLQLALYRSGSTQPIWAYAIAEGDCPFDLWVGVDTVTVTDLDKNGIAEVGVVLSHSCRSDVSPGQMQVLIHQSEETYRLAGDRWLSMLGVFPTPNSYAMSSVEDSLAYETQYDLPARWGRFRVAEAPNDIAGALREHARLLWRSQVIEKEFRSLSRND